MAIPKCLEQFLASLSSEEAEKVWIWADSADAAQQIIDVVAPLANQSITEPKYT